LIQQEVFEGKKEEFEEWRQSPSKTKRFIWNTVTKQLKLSKFTELFFNKLSKRLGGFNLLLEKGNFHKLVEEIRISDIDEEITQKLDLLNELMNGD
jgi:hypothetical protein